MLFGRNVGLPVVSSWWVTLSRIFEGVFLPKDQASSLVRRGTTDA